MPSLSIRFQVEREDTPFTDLNVIGCDEVGLAANKSGLPKAFELLGTTEEEWLDSGMEEAGGGVWEPSMCPWHPISFGLEWCDAIEVFMIENPNIFNVWKDQYDDVQEELKAMREAFQHARNYGGSWNMMGVT